ncbi:MAG: hypothetical protein LBL98_01515 [Ruminococcus sp.]|jgi:Zn finger protein HypA/HybF involved in hydrogenase expression|nr:hypothetical protein [Ruminococcus sp.]
MENIENLAEEVVGGFGLKVEEFGIEQRYILCNNCKQTVLVEPGKDYCPNCGTRY